MFKFLILFALTIVLFQAAPAYCESISLHISATIPQHVIMDNSSQVPGTSNNAQQLVQTQTIIKNDQTIQVTSIVAP